MPTETSQLYLFACKKLASGNHEVQRKNMVLRF